MLAYSEKTGLIFGMDETLQTRLKRLKIRSWRRGMKEMDLILGGFADRELHRLSAKDLDAYEALMTQNDPDIYSWITGAAKTPDEFKGAITMVCAHLDQN